MDEDVYKIGISNAPRKRLKALSTASPFELEMIHRFIAEPAKEAERRLHMLYENTRLNGEWFNLTTSQIKDLKKIKRFKDGVFLKESDS